MNIKKFYFKLLLMAFLPVQAGPPISRAELCEEFGSSCNEQSPILDFFVDVVVIGFVIGLVIFLVLKAYEIFSEQETILKGILAVIWGACSIIITLAFFYLVSLVFH